MSFDENEFCCKDLKQFTGSDDVGISYSKRFREFGVDYTDGTSSFQLIRFCPWCGCPLPSQLREKWFEELESLGIEPDVFIDDGLPEEYKSDRWWKDSGT